MLCFVTPNIPVNISEKDCYSFIAYFRPDKPLVAVTMFDDNLRCGRWFVADMFMITMLLQTNTTAR